MDDVSHRKKKRDKPTLSVCRDSLGLAQTSKDTERTHKRWGEKCQRDEAALDSRSDQLGSRASLPKSRQASFQLFGLQVEIKLQPLCRCHHEAPHITLNCIVITLETKIWKRWANYSRLNAWRPGGRTFHFKFSYIRKNGAQYACINTPL